jgi:hypothetical protein
MVCRRPPATIGPQTLLAVPRRASAADTGSELRRHVRPFVRRRTQRGTPSIPQEGALRSKLSYAPPALDYNT